MNADIHRPIDGRGVWQELDTNLCGELSCVNPSLGNLPVSPVPNAIVIEIIAHVISSPGSAGPPIFRKEG
jgi:hypothetical protein